ncbi:MAG: TetR/AcrR family transcriptional regulator [bacterium]|nr:TetR/AcrR family transcriptional regulator [bacterium]
MADKKEHSQEEDPKQRILDAATLLFSRKGYAGVGVREIAKEANVNIAMISYYFGGKTGILKEIIEVFFYHYLPILKESLHEDISLEEKVGVLVRNIVAFVKINRELCKVALYEFPFDMPEIAALKAEKMQAFIAIVRERVLTALGGDDRIINYLPIIGPAVVSMIFSNFMLGPIVERVFPIEFDDTFYEQYTESITALILGGVPNLLSEVVYKTNKNTKNKTRKEQ